MHFMRTNRTQSHSCVGVEDPHASEGGEEGEEVSVSPITETACSVT
jgi:hypothetical protein